MSPNSVPVVRGACRSNGIELNRLYAKDSDLYVEIPLTHFIDAQAISVLCTCVVSLGFANLFLWSGGVWFFLAGSDIGAYLNRELSVQEFVERWVWCDEVGDVEA